MNNKILLPVFLALAVLFGLAIGMFLSYPTKKFAINNTNEAREEKIKQIIDYVDFEYVDKVNTDSLLDITITDLLRRLDPHSTYIPLEEVAASEENIRGSFEGIGIEFKIFRDTLTVVNVLENGPSSKSGIKAGNRILYADGNSLFGKEVNNQFITESLKGASGTRVELKILDKITGNVLEKNVKRGKVSIKSVTASFLADDNIGYIKLVRFSETTTKEIEEALRELKKAGAEDLILDLRDNPGGLLSAAREVADQFLDDDKLIVFTKDRQGRQNDYYATSKGLFEGGKLIVLINEGSASASEIVAGAIQDNDRGVVIGRKSFGKGLVQEEMILRDGSKVRLTTQRYYTPTGRSIQKPYSDYKKGYLSSKGYDEKLPDQDSAAVSDRQFVTPNGKEVFAGGGIMPDIVITYDTSKAATVLYHMTMLVSFDDQAFKYVDEQRAYLNTINQEDFIENFKVDAEVISKIFPQSAKTINDLSPEILNMVKTRVKAYLAYNLYGNEAFLRVYFRQDPITRKSLEVMASDDI